jgi:hypothetical protein
MVQEGMPLTNTAALTEVLAEATVDALGATSFAVME